MTRFQHPEHGVLTVTANGVTFTATHYPAGNGQRGYWTVQRSDRDYDDGNDWYESSERNVRDSIAAVIAKETK